MENTPILEMPIEPRAIPKYNSVDAWDDDSAPEPATYKLCRIEDPSCTACQ